MKVRLNFYGGADEVTGSRHLLQIGATHVLLDCGLFQGHRREAIEKNRTFPFSVADLSAVILSHAHIDHSGGLPLLVKKGFSQDIHCTRLTAELSRVMLLDSAFLQEEDAKFFNKIHQPDGNKIEPLYNREDAERTIRLFKTHEYGEFFSIADNIQARFLNAGHVLGSSMIEVEWLGAKGKRRLLFTGDLGRRKSLLMEPPRAPEHVDYLMMESTYGNRLHESMDNLEKLFSEIIKQAVTERGRVLIPSFALERTQEIVFLLEQLRRENKIPPIHLYVDSPMAVDITEIFNKNLNCDGLSAEFKNYVSAKGNPFGFGNVRYIRLVEESKQLNEMPGPKIILAGSGMVEGGRILHHLRNNIQKDNTVVLLVGYQAQGTLGRRLADGAKKVKIFGLEHDVRATIRMLQNFSSHADQADLVDFVQKMDPRPQKIFLVHGDPEGRNGLTEQLKREGIKRVEIPSFGDTFELT